MNRSKLLVLVVALILIGVGIFSYFRFGNHNQIVTTDWKNYSDSNFDISLKYPPAWAVTKGNDDKGIYYFTITDPSQSNGSNNQITVSFTSHENCGSFKQPDSFQGLMVSDSNWRDEKGFEARSLCFPDKQFYLRMTATSTQTEDMEDQILATVKFSQEDTQGWKAFSDATTGIEFQYPPYLGHVVVEKEDSENCPIMKTYSRDGQLLSADYVIWFSDVQHVGTGGSYMDYYIPIVKTEGDTKICDTDLSDLQKNLASDPQGESSIFPQSYATQVFVSTVDTTLGTSADQFYTLFFKQQNSLTVIQPDITFIPVANSAEEGEIAQMKNSGTSSPIVDFILHCSDAGQIRNYMSDFKKVVDSMKVKSE